MAEIDVERIDALTNEFKAEMDALAQKWVSHDGPEPTGPQQVEMMIAMLHVLAFRQKMVFEGLAKAIPRKQVEATVKQVEKQAREQADRLYQTQRQEA